MAALIAREWEPDLDTEDAPRGLLMMAMKEKNGVEMEKGTARARHVSKRASAPSTLEKSLAPTDARQTAGNFAVQRLLQAGAIRAKLSVSRAAQ